MENPLVLMDATIVSLLDASHENNSALEAFNNPNLNQHPRATAIHKALTHVSLGRLKTILSSQIPLVVPTQGPKEALPASLDLSGVTGLYIRKKRSENKLFSCETTQMAQFIPDPFTSSVNGFTEFYSSPDESHYFQQDNSEFKIWDAQTGACVNDGAVFQAQMRKKFPHLLAANFLFAQPIIRGLSPSNHLAWMDLTGEDQEKIEYHAAGTYDFKKNRLHYFQDKEQFGAVSPSGKLITIFEHASGRVVVARTDNPSQAVIISEQHDIDKPIISPQDKYLIYQQSDIDERSRIYCCDLTNNNKRKLLYGKYTKVAFAPSGQKVAMRIGNELYIWDLSTKQHLISYKLTDGDGFEFIFSSDEAEVLIYETSATPDKPNLFFRAHIASKEISSQQSPHGHSSADMLFCNQGKYLLLPNSQLIMEPIGLASHLTLQELVGLLILEQQKTSGKPINTQIVEFFQHHPIAKIRRLITGRYTNKNSAPQNLLKRALKRHKAPKEETE